MQHVIRFNGHITWEGQANGLPPVIWAFLVVDGANDQFIVEQIEIQTAAFLRSQAMFVQREQGKVIDLRLTPAGRMVVPFHEIAYIDVDVLPLIGELSYEEDGVEKLSDGAEPVKQ